MMAALLLDGALLSLFLSTWSWVDDGFRFRDATEEENAFAKSAPCIKIVATKRGQCSPIISLRWCIMLILLSLST